MSSESQSSSLSLWATTLLVCAAFLALFNWDWWPQALYFSVPTCFLWSSFAQQLSLVCSAAWCWVGTVLSDALYPNKVSDLLVSKFENWGKIERTLEKTWTESLCLPKLTSNSQSCSSWQQLCLSWSTCHFLLFSFGLQKWNLVKTWTRSLKLPQLISNSLCYMTT